MKKLILLLMLCAVSGYGQLLRVPGCFHLYKEFYQAREFVKNRNSFTCKESAVYLWQLIGEARAEVVVFQLWGNNGKTHAVLFVPYSRLYMGCKEDSVSTHLPLGAKVVKRFMTFKDLPKSWEVGTK